MKKAECRAEHYTSYSIFFLETKTGQHEMCRQLIYCRASSPAVPTRQARRSGEPPTMRPVQGRASPKARLVGGGASPAPRREAVGHLGCAAGVQPEPCPTGSKAASQARCPTAGAGLPAEVVGGAPWQEAGRPAPTG